jgi:hypothetical protein
MLSIIGLLFLAQDYGQMDGAPSDARGHCGTGSVVRWASMLSSTPARLARVGLGSHAQARVETTHAPVLAQQPGHDARKAAGLKPGVSPFPKEAPNLPAPASCQDMECRDLGAATLARWRPHPRPDPGAHPGPLADQEQCAIRHRERACIRALSGRHMDFGQRHGIGVLR